MTGWCTDEFDVGTVEFHAHSAGHDWLSNSYKCAFEMDGVQYESAADACGSLGESRMRRILDAKFGSAVLREKLIASHPLVLVERSGDRRQRHVGVNLLGILLMELRTRLIAEVDVVIDDPAYLADERFACTATCVDR